jgi:NitT/TauT family transport system permease protein
MKKINAFLQGALVPVLVLIVWEAASRAGLFSPVVMPAPSAVATKWWAYLMPLQAQEPGQTTLQWLFSGELIHDAYSSLYRVVVGFLIGAGLALPIGLLMGATPRIYTLLNPLVQILRPIPPIAYIPLAILWFGLGNPPSFFLIAIGAFFPVLMNTIAGVRQVDGIYIRAARNPVNSCGPTKSSPA